MTKTKNASPEPAPNFLACEPQPYTLRNGEFGAVTGKGPDGGYVGFLLPSELKTSWDRLGNDGDGDKAFDLMELVRPGSPQANSFKAVVERLCHPGPGKLSSKPESD